MRGYAPKILPEEIVAVDEVQCPRPLPQEAFELRVREEAVTIQVGVKKELQRGAADL